MDGDDVSSIPKEEDPFWEPTEDVLIGTANVFLQSLCYALVCTFCFYMAFIICLIPQYIKTESCNHLNAK